MDEVDFIRDGWWVDLKTTGDLVLRRKRKAMGLTQEQMAAKIGVHRTRISRIEKGLGVPKDVPTGRAYVSAYRLNADETEEIFKLWFGTDPDGRYLEREIEQQYSSWPNTLYKIRLDGSPKIVMGLAHDQSGRLREYINHLSHPRETIFYKKILVEILREQIHALMEVTPRNKIWGVSHGLIVELAKLADECQDINLRGWVNLYYGDVFYIARDYPKSLYYMEQAWSDIMGADAQLRLLRVRALDWAYLNEKAEVKRVEEQFLKTVEQGNFLALEHVVEAYEGLGQAQSFVSIPQALDTIETGWKLYSKIKSEGIRAPYRSIQLAGSELGAIAKLSPTNKMLIESLGGEFLQLTRRLGYPRHEQKILRLLKTHLE